ncbi:hypothetical protein D9611_014320 [Ephemerocybe angulata]|uniref:galacturonan 1,4-alpha-galacturonidase n=1 Tax=Ephemerocybe angulata TaxID=980116 RepID=A0A8H5C391_9AGAR|nr:hypothetical protein D9611_014320 [Tulosesus angulatus]
MVVNATNTDPRWAGQTVVWNTDGIDTYRSDRITLRNWDVTCGDDCIAVKGNSTNIVARDFVCRGGTGVAFGSLGQYNGIHDIVKNVLIENVKILRLDPKVQPNMNHGIYFKAWDGVATGTPDTGGGGGSGMHFTFISCILSEISARLFKRILCRSLVENAIFRNFVFDRVQTGFQIVQNFGAPVDEVEVSSKVKFSKMLFENIRGTTNESTIVRFDCSSAEHCSDIRFKNVIVKGAGIQGAKDEYICKNAEDVTGLPVPCGN